MSILHPLSISNYRKKLLINGDGWLDTAIKHASEHYDRRSDSQAIDLLVVHNISLPPGQFGGGCIEAFFCGRLDASRHEYFQTIQHLRVSAHCLITRKGELIQFVSFKHRAWHAGQSCYEGREQCNDFSIGVELEGTDTLAYEPVQYLVLAQLTRSLAQYYPNFSLKNIAGHSDIAPGRKTDPGESFDWQHFRSLLDAREGA